MVTPSLVDGQCLLIGCVVLVGYLVLISHTHTWTHTHTHTHTLSHYTHTHTHHTHTLSHCPVRDQRGVNTREGTREKEDSNCGFETALPRGQGLPVS